MGRHKSKWALFRGRRFAVLRVSYDYVEVQNPGIQFRQGAKHAIAILRFGDDLRGLSSSEFFPLRDSRPVQQFLEQDSLVCFRFIVMRIDDRESFARFFSGRPRLERGAWKLRHQFAVRNGRCGLCSLRTHISRRRKEAAPRRRRTISEPRRDRYDRRSLPLALGNETSSILFHHDFGGLDHC